MCLAGQHLTQRRHVVCGGRRRRENVACGVEMLVSVEGDWWSSHVSHHRSPLDGRLSERNPPKARMRPFRSRR